MLTVQLAGNIQIETDNLIEEIKECELTEQNVLLRNIGKHLLGWQTVENMALMNQAKILYHIYKLWDDISTEAKSEWSYNFYTWAKQFTRRRSVEPAESTIDNKITVYRDYIAEGLIEAPQVIYIPQRDSSGKLTSKTDDWITMSPDFEKCDFSKLLIARGIARKGLMTPDAWTALFDPQATVQQLNRELNIAKNKNTLTEIEDDFRLFEDDGIVYACCNGQTIPICQLNLDDMDNLLWKRGINHLLSSVQLHTSLIYKEA